MAPTTNASEQHPTRTPRVADTLENKRCHEPSSLLSRTSGAGLLASRTGHGVASVAPSSYKQIVWRHIEAAVECVWTVQKKLQLALRMLTKISDKGLCLVLSASVSAGALPAKRWTLIGASKDGVEGNGTTFANLSKP